jgi:two-component system chemotaxis response regulator CheB
MTADSPVAASGSTEHVPKAIAIGASAGALDALSIILPVLPRDFPLPIFLVVHLAPSRDSLLVELLRDKCLMDVQEVEDKEPIVPGTVFVAPPDYHMLVESDVHLSLSADEPVNYSRPSIDVLFESAADAYGAGLIGIILTGANDDGARGLRAIVQAGGTALVQCPEQSYAPAMPSAAIDSCPAARVLTIETIANYLLDIARIK